MGTRYHTDERKRHIEIQREWTARRGFGRLEERKQEKRRKKATITNWVEHLLASQRKTIKTGEGRTGAYVESRGGARCLRLRTLDQQVTDRLRLLGGNGAVLRWVRPCKYTRCDAIERTSSSSVV